MKKIIREVDEEHGVVQITVADERWYTKPSRSEVTDMPIYLRVPSVTWIAGYYPKGIGFYKWLAEKGWDEAQAVKQAAGDKGSLVHAAIEMILSGEEFRIDTELPDRSRESELEAPMRSSTYEELVCIQSFIDWRKEMEEDYTIESVSAERNVFSEIHGFAGTVDWIVFFTPKPEGKDPLKLGKRTPFVIDFKTSKQIWTEYEMQVSAYGETLTNGENPIKVVNANGTETDELVDLSGLRLAILQVGYAANKAGYKFNLVANQFDLFKVAQQIWRHENVSKKTGELTSAGFSVIDFPIVLSAKVEKKVEEVVASLPTHPEGPTGPSPEVAKTLMDDIPDEQREVISKGGKK